MRDFHAPGGAFLCDIMEKKREFRLTADTSDNSGTHDTTQRST